MFIKTNSLIAAIIFILLSTLSSYINSSDNKGFTLLLIVGGSGRKSSLLSFLERLVFINKHQRAERRIKRDMALKHKVRVIKFDDVMTRKSLLWKAKTCQKNVSWKPSVQKFAFTPITSIHNIVSQYEKGEFPALETDYKTLIYERGHAREITPNHIKDRVQQNTFCTHLFLPSVTPYLIYDNGASLQDKGTSFARGRVEKFLKKAARKWGNDFYILKFDFRHYFDSIDHQIIMREVKKYIKDKKALEFIEHIIVDYKLVDINSQEISAAERLRLTEECKALKSVGISLGSEISQITALFVPNEIDHMIKEKCHMKFYARYMDDGIIIAETKEELLKVLEEIKRLCKKLNLELHPDKTQIVKASKGITYLQRRYHVTETGKLIKRLSPENINRMRKKLIKFHRLYQSGKMSLKDVNTSFDCWLGHCKNTHSYKSRKNLITLYNELFNEKYKRRKALVEARLNAKEALI